MPIAPWTALRRHLLDTVFPPRCTACHTRGAWLCAACWRLVERLPLPICGVCGQPIAPGDRHGCHPAAAAVRTLTAIGLYRGPLRTAIHALKYEGRHAIAAPLAHELSSLIAPLLQTDDLLIPVPLHPLRERERGYNQSAILGAALANQLSLEQATTALRRTRRTASQTQLSTAARARNVHGAFAAEAPAVSGRRIILIDDVATTGATLRAAAMALRTAGAREVYAAVIARTDHP